jgi:hypothetical protein
MPLGRDGRSVESTEPGALPSPSPPASSASPTFGSPYSLG